MDNIYPLPPLSGLSTMKITFFAAFLRFYYFFTTFVANKKRDRDHLTWANSKTYWYTINQNIHNREKGWCSIFPCLICEAWTNVLYTIVTSGLTFRKSKDKKNISSLTLSGLNNDHLLLLLFFHWSEVMRGGGNVAHRKQSKLWRYWFYFMFCVNSLLSHFLFKDIDMI